ncbi:MAG TPA: S-methyl-5'-thioadenosine phosphorylase, partial [bacterium]|nr:S-methyl-5'-thioadenosine phosphorylase [bacterium]
EAELCYATLALSTDYDCWHPGHDNVTVDAVMAVMAKNIDAAKKTVSKAAPAANRKTASCACGTALKFAVMTDPKRVPPRTREKLDLLVGKYLPPG